MAFDVTTNVEISHNPAGQVVLVQHRQGFFAEDAGLEAPSVQELAASYVRAVASLYGLTDELLSDLSGEISDALTSEGTRLKRTEVKTVMDTTVVSYQQTHLGLPKWEAVLEVRVHGDPLRVVSSNSTLQGDVQVERPAPGVVEGFTGDDPAAVGTALGLAAAVAQGFAINGTRLLIYRYVAAERLDPSAAVGEGGPLQGAPPTLPLPAVSHEDGRDYVVREVLFTLAVPGWGELHWRAFIDPENREVLYLRAFVASATACVFLADPVTSTGTLFTGCSPEADLNAVRTDVTLLGLAPPGDGAQALRGNFVQLVDTDAPVAAPPTTTAPFSFCYSAISNDFAAANAYCHYDGVYRLVEGMGFNIDTYFDGTSFPIPVDHQGFVNQVNASAAGNAAGNGMGKYRNGFIRAGCPVGIASDRRVVLHEFGHALLWDHVNSPNFGFCHSAGDTLAAVLHDPGSKAPDRFQTFPFPGIDRRHDRDVAAGWAWGGSRDDKQYGSEQILSTLLFRVYRATGGDDTDIEVQRFTARYLAFLIFKAIGTLTVTTRDPRVFATAMMDADDSTTVFDGHPGGAWHKVIRWSFEQQGLYQPVGASTPVTRPGAPPPVDVFIDDGRNGGYMPYLPDFATTADIWNRQAADGDGTHEDPQLGQTNYVYVRVKNRGTQPANNVVVKVFQGDPASGLVWPTGWQAVTTPQLPAAGPIPPGDQTVVGPFEWTPQISGQESLLASVSAPDAPGAPGDLSNADTVNGAIPHWRLVPFDNNVAQRNVSPTPGAVSTVRIAGGATRAGEGWQVHLPTGIYIDVDTSQGKFRKTPVYVTSLGGNSSHWATTGGNAVYNPTPIGFRVYVRWSGGTPLTPAEANADQWRVHWFGIEE